MISFEEAQKAQEEQAALVAQNILADQNAGVIAMVENILRVTGGKMAMVVVHFANDRLHAHYAVDPHACVDVAEFEQLKINGEGITMGTIMFLTGVPGLPVSGRWST